MPLEGHVPGEPEYSIRKCRDEARQFGKGQVEGENGLGVSQAHVAGRRGAGERGAEMNRSQLQCRGKSAKGAREDSYPDCALLGQELPGHTGPAQAHEPCPGAGEAT